MKSIVLTILVTTVVAGDCYKKHSVEAASSLPGSLDFDADTNTFTYE